jgi:hypothetical protein
MSKLLDLRNKGIEKVKVVERVIFKPRSFKYEMVRMFIVIFTVAAIGFGISNADDIPIINQIISPKEEVKPTPFSAVGIVSEINEENLTISPAKSADREEESFTISLSKLKTVETNTFDELTVTDLKAGDKIVVQGAILDNEIFARKIINFSPRFLDTVTAGKYPYIEPALFVSEMATTTEDVATTTIDTASTTEVSTTTDETGTTTEESSTTTDTSSESNDQNIVEQVIETITETVKGVVDTVVETVTNITNPEETPAPEDTSSQTEESSSSESSSSDTSSSELSSGDSAPSSD